MAPIKFTLLARGSQSDQSSERRGRLFEIAPDSSLALADSTTITNSPAELIGSRNWAEDRAAELLKKLRPCSPIYREIPILHTVEEQIMHDLVKIFQALKLDSFLREQGVSVCKIAGEHHWADNLRAIQTLTNSSYTIVTNIQSDNPIRKKLDREFSPKHISNWPRIARFAFRRISPTQSMWFESKFARTGPISPGGIWFFGAAYNTTAIGIAYGQALPQLKHAFTDPHESGNKLLESGKLGLPVFKLLAFTDLPSRNDSKRVSDELRGALNDASLSGDESIVRDVYIRSSQFGYLLDRIIPWSTLSTVAAEKFLAVTSPEILVVGNAAFERPLLLLAKSRGIPTVMLQHGVIHSYYRLLDQPVDHFLVRGDFFLECVGPSLREKSTVLNVPGPSKSEARDCPPGTDLVFITSPIEVEPRWDGREISELLRVLLNVGSSHNRKVIIRVHPTENVEVYRSLVEALLNELTTPPKVEFSQGPGLQEVVGSAAVVVLFNSTVFLDCLASGVPIISFDWHDFPFKEKYKKTRVFEFASDLNHLQSLIVNGLQRNRTSRQDLLDRFLRPTTAQEVRAFFADLTKENKNASLS